MSGMELLAQVQESIRGCERCHLSSNCNGPIPVQGLSRARLLVVGEAPRAHEDEAGVPFIDGSGHLMRKVIAKEGIHSRDVAYTNTVKCTTGHKKRPPHDYELEACRANLVKEMAVVDARVVLLVGAVALKSFRPDLLVTHHWGVPMMIDKDRVAIGCTHPAAALANDRLTFDIAKVVKQAKMRMRRGRMMDNWPTSCIECGEEGDRADSMGVFYCEEHGYKMDAWMNVGSQLGLEMN